MKKVILASAVLAAFTASVRAEEAKQDNEVSFNAAVTSDYRYRGISQTRLKPALQGGADFTNNPSGLYLGAWASTIKWTKDAGGGGDVELDLYGGKRGQVTADISYDVGVLSYVYANNGLKHVPGFANADTTEIYDQLGFGPATLKYSHSLTNLFGYVDSKNSGYLDLSANIDAGNGYTVNLHAGHQRVHNNSIANYTDWKAGVNKDLGFASVQLAAVGTNASKTAYASPANGKFLGRSALQLTLSKTF
jgi:uncharacterized protein (TIGR02001 family)